jgi:hypothetical protein
MKRTKAMQTQDILDQTTAASPARTLPFALILRQLRRHHFAVLSTVGRSGHAQSAGVSYGVSAAGAPFALYVMSRTHLQKARNISWNPSVSLVIPLPRRVLWFLPSPTLHVRGQAEIFDWTDPVGTAVFQQFWLGQRILAGYQAAARKGETRICFIKITPDPVISTYMVGTSLWRLLGDMEAGAGTARIPQQ